MQTRHDLRPAVAVLAAAGALVAASGPARAHVKYVTERSGARLDPVEFAVSVLSDPAVAATFVVTGAVAALAAVGYVAVRPHVPDVDVLRETLSDYRDLVPWLLRLSIGLPLVGAGFSGYYFSPAVPASARVLQVAVGFLLLFGVATRVVALFGLAAYLVGLAWNPQILLAMEYVPGLLAIAMLGSGRPSADHVLRQVADAPDTLYGRLDPIHEWAETVEGRTSPYAKYVPTVLRVGLGVMFIYLGVVEKLLDPGHAMLVVHKYQLGALLPLPPETWVVGAALTEVTLGVALILGLFTRGVAIVALLMFTLTLFGLPDDPVLAHITLFGMVSAVFVLGSGPFAVDNRLSELTPNWFTPSTD